MSQQKKVGYWLLLGVFMLIIQVLLGGITRLTGSGLSITEWKPLLGALPPMNEEAWQESFRMYREMTGQSKFLNADFDLSDYKFIYFWEWLHRNWARLISVVFLLPFFYFLIKGYFNRSMIMKLLMLFVLGLAQGLIGWIMVKSGLNDDNLYVSHIRLAVHFISALVLIAFNLWFALSLLVYEGQRVVDARLKNFVIIILGILTVQLVYGAFMAGLKAATTAATWPDINGDYFPGTLLDQSLVNNPINIHFIHRMLAYTLFFLVIVLFIKSRKYRSFTLFSGTSWGILLAVIFQVLLGICTILVSTQQTRNGFGVFEYLAQAHQLVAMFLSMLLVCALYLLRRSQVPVV